MKYNMFICDGSNMLNGRTMSTRRKRYDYTMKCNKDQMWYENKIYWLHIENDDITWKCYEAEKENVMCCLLKMVK